MTPLFIFNILISIFISFGIVEPTPKNIVITNSVYTINYSQDFEQPLSIEYRVKCTLKSKEYYSRTGLNFYLSPEVHTSDDKDYYKNQYDKGHMAPAAAFNCDNTSLKLTFSYVNCALQHEDLNRGAWKQLEAYEKELATNNIVTIKILVDFSQSSRLPTGAMIPTGFSKEIILNGKLFKLYYFPNKPTKLNFEKFIVKKY
jgi:endonuclease G